MRNFIVIALFVALINVAWSRPAEDKYTDEYDNFDVEEVLKSERLFNNYINCIKTGTKCTKEGTKLREYFPDALKTNCDKCTDVQKNQGRRVLKFLVEEKPKVFRELEDQFDPEHFYRQKFASEIEKEGVKLPPL